MFQAAKGFKKEDLLFVAEEIGATLPQKVTISELKEAILKSKQYSEDPQFVEDILVTTVSDRKHKELAEADQKRLEYEEKQKQLECDEKQKQYEERERIRLHELELARIQVNSPVAIAGSEAQTSDSTIPAKYLKKYAKSTSVENDKELFGAVSMPHLNAACKPGDSYSALGLYSENDPDNSMNVDDEVDARRYFSGSQSVLSLGSHSASMTSVYSAGGCHYGYVTISGDVLFGLNYNQKSQMMEVFVKQCRNLAASDARNNKSNPYVKVYLLPDKTRSGKRKTKTKKNTLNPVFNELLRFPVLKNELESRTLWLTVWNSDLFGRNDFLGEISLPLGYRLLDSPTLRWYPLQERAESLTSPLNYRGELFIALKYVPRDLSLESRFRPAPVISVRGALHVLVKEARNISTNNSSSPLDAFCKSYLLPDKSKSSKQKTPIVKKSRHPKWYYTVIYEDLSVDDLRERSLELTVWDYDKITSNHFLGGVRLNTGSGLYHGVPVDWMDSRRDESSLWQSMLESPNMWVDGCLPLRPTLHSHLS